MQKRSAFFDEAREAGMPEAQARAVFRLVESAEDRLVRRSDLEKTEAKLEARITEVKPELKQDIAEVHAKIDTGLAEVHAKIDTGLADLRTEIAERFSHLYKQQIVMVISIVGLTVTLVKFLPGPG